MENNNKKSNGVLGWIGIVLAIIAIIIAWATYTRVNPEGAKNAKENYAESIASLDLKVAKLQASAQLAYLQSEYVVKKNYDEFQSGVEKARLDLKASYEKTKMEGSDDWKNLDQKFTDLGMQIKEKSSSIVETIKDLINSLRG